MKLKIKLLVFILLGISIQTFSQSEIDLLILNKNYDQAIKAINKQLAISPNANLYFKKGMVYSNLQNYQEALSAYSEALFIEPENVEILSEMAENLSTLGNQQDAENFFDKAIQLNPENLTLKAKLGRVYINQEKIKPAYNVFAEIYAKDSSNVYWNKQFAYCSFKTGRRLQAIYLYKKVLEENPRDHTSYINLIHCYNWKKEREDILTAIDRGLEQFPDNDELFLERANLFLKNKKYSDAKINFENYFAAQGDTIYDLYLSYAICNYFSSNEKDAMDILSDLFRVNPNNPLVQFYIALCYKKMNDLPNAEKYMQWAIDASFPDYLPNFYHHLGQIYGLDRKFKESIAALKKANELDPTDYEVLFEIATTYEEFNNNKTLALTYYRLYLKEAGESAQNMNYVLDRITKIKEDLFMNE